MKTFNLVDQSIPERLRIIPQPVRHLYVASENWDEILSRPAVAIVGSRKPTSYGDSVTERLARELAGQGVAIVSGLAYGIDAQAHRAALKASGLSVAVLPSSLDAIYPRSHQKLAQEIVTQGGALISEYPTGAGPPHPYTFVERNRLIAGFAHVIVVPEATLQSGSRHTVDFALDQGKPIGAVPGNITNPLSAGPNRHISDGANVILNSRSILQMLQIHGFSHPQSVPTATDEEQVILSLIAQGIIHTENMLQKSHLPVALFNQTLTLLEITGKIRRLSDDRWTQCDTLAP